MAQDFFGRFTKLVTPADAAPAAGDAPAAPAQLATAPQTDEAAALDAAARQTRSLPPWIWITGLILLVIVIVALAAR